MILVDKNKGIDVLSDEVSDVVFRSCEEIVHADNVVAAVDQVGAEVRADESGTARDQNASLILTRLGFDEGFPVREGRGHNECATVGVAVDDESSSDSIPGRSPSRRVRILWR